MGIPAAAGLQAAAPQPAPAAQGPVWVVKVDSHTGKLVRMLSVPPQLAAKRAADVRSLVDDAARAFDVNPLLVDSVIQVESNYNPFAVSPKGAEGLMQLMPGTAQRFGATDVFDPKQNIEAGVRYLKFLQDTFQDDRLALAAYNAGERAVAKYSGLPPYAETLDYVTKVGKKFNQAKHAADVKSQAASEAKKASSSDDAKAEDQPRHVLAYVDPEGRLHLATQ